MLNLLQFPPQKKIFAVLSNRFTHPAGSDHSELWNLDDFEASSALKRLISLVIVQFAAPRSHGNVRHRSIDLRLLERTNSVRLGRCSAAVPDPLAPRVFAGTASPRRIAGGALLGPVCARSRQPRIPTLLMPLLLNPRPPQGWPCSGVPNSDLARATGIWNIPPDSKQNFRRRPWRLRSTRSLRCFRSGRGPSSAGST